MVDNICYIVHIYNYYREASMIDRARLDQRAAIVKAMASSSRLAIVEELSRKSRAVGELAEILELDISTVSRHLTVLRNAGIVSSVRQGISIVYSLRAVCVLQFFDCVERILEGDTGNSPVCCPDTSGRTG
jgi:ArsR family transcriptional regulator